MLKIRAVVWAIAALAACSPAQSTDSEPAVGSGFPFLAITPKAIDFDSVEVGASADVALTIANVGVSDLDLQDVRVVDDEPTVSLEWPGAMLVAPGQLVDVAVHWNPATFVDLASSLQIASNDLARPLAEVALVGVTPDPDIDVSPATWEFGTVDVGTTSVMGVSIANLGAADLTVTSIDYSASDGDLTLDAATLPFVVAPSESVDLRVTYRPTSDGIDSGTLMVGSDDPDEPAVAAEQGGTGVKGFVLLVTETGSGSSAPSAWGGILQFRLSESGAPLEPIPGIDATDVHDPTGLAWHGVDELFVGNRHGEVAADGVPGSIQRFVYDSYARTFTPNGEITGNDLDAVCQVNFDPLTDELLAANFGGGISRFLFDGAGGMVANGTIPVDHGDMRGVIVSPRGAQVWATTADRWVRQFDITTGLELTPVAAGPGASLHFLTLHDGQLYVAGVDAIYRYDIGPDDELQLADRIEATLPISVAFSPDGLEMYSSSHTYCLIERFAYDEIEDTWTLVDSYDTGTSIGSILVVE